MKRIILHIDMNSYFASVEQQANPFLRGKPIVVSGRPYINSVVAAASIEAKKYGVKSGMSTWEAKKLCPNLIFIPGDPEKYIDTTGKIIAIFKNYTPLVEVFSIDEVFLDLTPVSDNVTSAVQVALKIKQRIKEEIGEGLTCSIGIAENKLLAKLASEKQKPDGLTVIDENNLNEMLLSSKLVDFCGLGRQTLARLTTMGISTVSQLQQIPLGLLTAAFGKARGEFLFNLARGIDHSPLVPDFGSEDQKSFSHSLTLATATVDRNYIEAVMLRLAERVGRRMRAENYLGKTVHIYLRYGDRSGFGQQKTLAHHTADGYEIFATAQEISWDAISLAPVRMVALGVSNVIKQDYLCLSLLPEKIKADKILVSMDAANDRFGENTVFRAAVLPAFEREERVAGIRTKLRFN